MEINFYDKMEYYNGEYYPTVTLSCENKLNLYTFEIRKTGNNKYLYFHYHNSRLVDDFRNTPYTNELMQKYSIVAKDIKEILDLTNKGSDEYKQLWWKIKQTLGS